MEVFLATRLKVDNRAEGTKAIAAAASPGCTVHRGAMNLTVCFCRIFFESFIPLMAC